VILLHCALHRGNAGGWKGQCWGIARGCISHTPRMVSRAEGQAEERVSSQYQQQASALTVRQGERSQVGNGSFAPGRSYGEKGPGPDYGVASRGKCPRLSPLWCRCITQGVPPMETYLLEVNLSPGTLYSCSSGASCTGACSTCAMAVRTSAILQGFGIHGCPHCSTKRMLSGLNVSPVRKIIR
jgi:hypothetical protein